MVFKCAVRIFNFFFIIKIIYLNVGKFINFGKIESFFDLILK